MKLCDQCLCELNANNDVGGICLQCHSDWLEYREQKRDEEPRETE